MLATNLKDHTSFRNHIGRRQKSQILCEKLPLPFFCVSGGRRPLFSSPHKKRSTEATI